MPPSTGIQPKSGYNFVLFDYQGPQTNLAEVIGYDKPSAGTAWWSIDNANHKLKIDTIGEYTSAAGVTLDGVLLKDNYLVKGYTDYSGSVSVTASGSMTIVGTPTFSYCRYAHLTSNLTMFQWNITALELGGTASTEFRISLPVAPAVNSHHECYLYPNITSTASDATVGAHSHQNSMRLGLVTVSTGGYVAVQTPVLGNFVLGSGYESRGTVLYWR